jgi:hypothetical protein
MDMGSDLETRNYYTIHLYYIIIKVMAKPYQLQGVFDGDMASHEKIAAVSN